MFDAGRLPPLREIVGRFDIAAQKSLGQHFLFDLNLTRRIASAAGDLGDLNVIEIGAGPGGLTRALLESRARHVYAVERDPRAVAALRELAESAGGRLTVIEADALGLDLTSRVPAPRRVVSNLPYNVGTPLLVEWLSRADAFLGFTLMFQKEVAERIVASPRSKAYGRLSVISQWLTDARIVFDVPASAFVPPPNVTSSVVNMEVRTVPRGAADHETLELVTRAAFGQRRKMLRRALSSLGGAELLEAAGVPGDARAEDLEIEQFCALARALRDQHD
ncbi:MAG: 16S rRNA (adenine(1518)-N(6)/adenine(1519)-N(6))-dimethyltransferase RsmA [Alphaproteobacteria bacterium]|nr:16S rRNA (adenine(1518)-N(6)/adenine(1519)-N(6))-dimethyltransferase RsmA [Alphaproteobacteria bacterium]